MKIGNLLLLLFLLLLKGVVIAQKIDDGYSGGHIKGISSLKKSLTATWLRRSSSLDVRYTKFVNPSAISACNMAEPTIPVCPAI